MESADNLKHFLATHGNDESFSFSELSGYVWANIISQGYEFKEPNMAQVTNVLEMADISDASVELKKELLLLLRGYHGEISYAVNFANLYGPTTADFGGKQDLRDWCHGFMGVVLDNEPHWKPIMVNPERSAIANIHTISLATTNVKKDIKSISALHQSVQSIKLFFDKGASPEDKKRIAGLPGIEQLLGVSEASSNLPVKYRPVRRSALTVETTKQKQTKNTMLAFGAGVATAALLGWSIGPTLFASPDADDGVIGSSIAALSEEAQRAKEALELKEKQLDLIDEELDRKESLIASLEEELGEFKETKLTLEEQVELLSADAEESDDLKTKLSSLTEVNSLLTSELEALQAELERTKEETVETVEPEVVEPEPEAEAEVEVVAEAETTGEAEPADAPETVEQADATEPELETETAEAAKPVIDNASAETLNYLDDPKFERDLAEITSKLKSSYQLGSEREQTRFEAKMREGKGIQVSMDEAFGQGYGLIARSFCSDYDYLCE